MKLRPSQPPEDAHLEYSPHISPGPAKEWAWAGGRGCWRRC
ncbi:hypothetical protein NAS2_0401 [Conexivisphaera calida]|uniref:Uncharacterized protein n=1 Tax=Conexivisphaera calida TaxID=1874277 RepID=A0A4P2VCF7_9ARCH|nr:hypothetical protein NAS2_0401 [Conexivisphaera calida]